MKITTGNLQVIDSGIVHSNNMEDVSFIINDDPMIVFKVCVRRFDNQKRQINVFPADNNNVSIIEFINQMDYPGVGPKNLLKIEYKNYEPIYASIRLSIYGHYESYELKYTFYKEISL